MYYFLKPSEIIYTLLKVMNLNYDRKVWQRVINDTNITTKEKQKHLTNAMQRILKSFYLGSQSQEYLLLYSAYHAYIDI